VLIVAAQSLAAPAFADVKLPLSPFGSGEIR
jgi:hypothetical protein